MYTRSRMGATCLALFVVACGAPGSAQNVVHACTNLSSRLLTRSPDFSCDVAVQLRGRPCHSTSFTQLAALELLNNSKRIFRECGGELGNNGTIRISVNYSAVTRVEAWEAIRHPLLSCARRRFGQLRMELDVSPRQHGERCSCSDRSYTVMGDG